MNPLRALIWKEGREAIYKIAVGACLGLFVGLLTHNAPAYPLELICHLIGFFSAVLMGMDAVAGERSRGTLPFLFIRPLDRGRLLGAKFVVGAAGLLVILAAYWAGVYIGMPEWGNPHFLWGFSWEPVTSFPPLYLEAILTDVGYVRHCPAVVFFLSDLVHCGVPRLGFFRPFRPSSDNRPDDGLGWAILRRLTVFRGSLVLSHAGLPLCVGSRCQDSTPSVRATAAAG